MARSLKKGPFVHHSLEKKLMKNVEDGKKTVIKTWSRASLITPDFVGQTIGVHNGKTLYLFILLKIWLDTSLGNFL